jgi:hypothetical protein
MEAGGLLPRWGAYARRLPSSLEDLRGPAAGEVELPLHVAWSGRRVYDVSQEDQRLVLYALLLAEAQREDLERFVHRESLVSMWPRLRRLLGPHARREWERQLIRPASGSSRPADLWLAACRERVCAPNPDQANQPQGSGGCRPPAGRGQWRGGS